MGVLDEPPVGLCASARKLTRGSIGPCVCGAAAGAPFNLGCGRARLAVGSTQRSGPQRIASYRGAREVLQPGWCARGPLWLQKSSRDVWPREAAAVAAAVRGTGA